MAMTVAIPITDFLCESCLNSERESVWHLPSPYIRFDVPVPVPLAVGIVTVSVDVESIVWKRSGVGVYAAVAMLRIICPCCESVREIQRHVHACRIVVAASAVCGNCGGPLRLDDDEIEYSGGPADSPLVTIRASLICCACKSAHVKRSAIMAVGEMLSHGSDVEAVIDNRDVRLRPGRGNVPPE